MELVSRPDLFLVLLLLGTRHARTNERRVAHDERALVGGELVVPVEPQCIAHRDVRRGGDGEAGEVATELVGDLAVFLVVHEVQRSPRDARRELFELDAVELPDGHLAEQCDVHGALAG